VESVANRLSTPNVVTRDFVKTVLQISDTSQDTNIDLWLPIVTGDVIKITNQMWIVERDGDTDGTDIIGIKTKNLDLGQVLVAGTVTTTITAIDDDAYKIKTNDFNAVGKEGISSESIGSYSYTLGDGDAGTEMGYPRTIIKALGKITKPRFF
jgi:hypothetical protein